jgi:hypothetical protein
MTRRIISTVPLLQSWLEFGDCGERLVNRPPPVVAVDDELSSGAPKAPHALPI